MIALDTSILIPLMVSSHSEHTWAKAAVEQLDNEVCTTPTNIGECLRFLTHPKAFSKPLKTSQAVRLLSSLAESLSIRILEESPHWWRELPEIESLIPGLRANEIFDARIALCLRSSNVRRIFTKDADFKKYPFLKTIAPLKPPAL
jgi:uncharacterized protein